MKTESHYLTKREASTYSTLSPRSLDYARERGQLPFLQVGRRVVFATSDLDKFMSRFRVDATPKAG